MGIATRIALKHALVGLVAIVLGTIVWARTQGETPNLAGLAAVGAILAMSVAWAAREAFAAGVQEGERLGSPQGRATD